MLATGAAADRSHGLVWALFNDGAKTKRDYLFREVEAGSYLIISPTAPHDSHKLWCLESQPYEPALVAGDRLGFILRANPVVTVPRPGLKRGHRADAIMHAKSKMERRKTFAAADASAVAVDWLAKRGTANGFQVDTSVTSAEGYLQVRVAHKSGEPPIQFSQIDISGILTVRDPTLLQSILTKGIGKARAFGCGLMLIRRAH
ncbi:MAG: type I-E CRISPR-associated protein Cas6/Cse3/CasE [Hyphomicrobiaceae bacterium]